MSAFRSFLAGLAILGAAGAAQAAGPSVSIDGAWCRVSEVRAHTAFVYLTLTVQGEPSDRLIGASTPLADAVEILVPQMSKGRESLQAVSAVSLDSHAPTVLQPQGTHLFLKDLKQKLAPGDTFTLSLQFDHAGKHDATVKVLKQPPASGMPVLPKGVKLE